MKIILAVIVKRLFQQEEICKIKELQEYEKNKILELNNLIDEKEEHIEFLKNIIKHFVKYRADKLNEINDLQV